MFKDENTNLNKEANVTINNLDSDYAIEDLITLAESHGKVLSQHLKTADSFGKKRGYVQFSTVDEATSFVNKLNGTKVGQNVIEALIEAQEARSIRVAATVKGNVDSFFAAFVEQAKQYGEI